MPNALKVEKVEALRSRIEGAEALLLAEYRGLSVHDATEVRRSLSGLARFSVVKNTLFQRAAADAGLGELEALLDGPTAVAFVNGDVVAAAKKVVEAGRRFPALVLKGAYMEGKLLSAAEAQGLASLESRVAMLSKVAGLMKAEMSRAASMFQAVQGRFVGVLEAYKDKLQPAEPEPAAPVEVVSDATDTAEAETPSASEAEVSDPVEAEAESPSEASSPPETEPSTDTVGDGASEEIAAEGQSSDVDQTPEAEASAGDEEE